MPISTYAFLFLFLPSQLIPANQSLHSHLYLEMSFGSFMQVASFWQGLLSHGKICTVDIISNKLKSGILYENSTSLLLDIVNLK